MKDLFGNEIHEGELDPKKKVRKSIIAHHQLTQIYGESKGNKCKDCKFLYWKSYSKSYPKCEKSGLDGCTQNTDWSSRWQACGLFEKAE